MNQSKYQAICLHICALERLWRGTGRERWSSEVALWERHGCHPWPAVPLARQIIYMDMWSNSTWASALWCTFVIGYERNVESNPRSLSGSNQQNSQCGTRSTKLRTNSTPITKQLAGISLRKPLWAPCALSIKWRLSVCGPEIWGFQQVFGKWLCKN